MRQFLEFVLGRLVDHPDELVVTQGEDGAFIFFKISAHPDDIGRVVGKGGSTISAIRSLMEAAAIGTGRKVAVEVIEAPSA